MTAIAKIFFMTKSLDRQAVSPRVTSEIALNLTKRSCHDDGVLASSGLSAAPLSTSSVFWIRPSSLLSVLGSCASSMSSALVRSINVGLNQRHHQCRRLVLSALSGCCWPGRARLVLKTSDSDILYQLAVHHSAYRYLVAVFVNG